MSQTLFETVSADELLQRHDDYWKGALYALGVEVLDAEEDPAAEPVSFVLPYRAAFARYQTHVARCAHCSESFMDQCLEGDQLSDRAAKAMTALDSTGALN